MIGGIPGLVAQFAFWILLVLGLVYGQLNKVRAVVFVLLWLAGTFGVPRLAWWASSLVTSWIAVLDVVLVLLVFRGDVRLT